MAGRSPPPDPTSSSPTVRVVAASCYDQCDGVRPHRGEHRTVGSALAHFPSSRF
jgi:hypothetical protein